MFNVQLFLGFPLDSSFEEIISKSHPQLFFFFTKGEKYLIDLVYDKQRYLGKLVPSAMTINELEDLEIHLLSLLKRLAPQYPFSQNPPMLMCINDDLCERNRS
ncbi:MAG: hypothetical protein R3E91_04040 [Chlamydiales bacterium]